MTENGLAYCVECGKPLTGKQRKYCSTYCHDKFNNTKKRLKRRNLIMVAIMHKLQKPIVLSKEINKEDLEVIRRVFNLPENTSVIKITNVDCKYFIGE